MAITLQITDGTDTVDFHDTTNLYLGAAFQMNVGEGAVTEQIIAGWANGLTADQKAVISKKFNRLIRKAILHYREQRIDRAVWLVWKPDDQTDTQYAKVMGGGEVEIVKHTIGGWGGGYFNPTIIREGAWRDTAPNSASGTLVVNGSTVYNKSDADGDNWVDIANTRTNDAPNLVQMSIGGSTAFTQAVVAMKRFTNTTAADKFNPHFNPTDQTSAQTETSDTAAPADFRIDMSADGSITWDIADTDLPSYVGAYNVYVSTYRDSGTSTATIKFFTEDEAGTTVDINNSASLSRLFLGTFQIPGAAFNPLVVLDTTADYEIGVTYDITGTGTYRFYGLFLVPVDIPPVVVDLETAKDSAQSLMIDGTTETCYLIVTATSGIILNNPATLRGRYLKSMGGEVNRIFFYEWDGDAYVHNDSFTVYVWVVDRFLGLRGNT